MSYTEAPNEPFFIRL